MHVIIEGLGLEVDCAHCHKERREEKRRRGKHIEGRREKGKETAENSFLFQEGERDGRANCSCHKNNAHIDT